MALALRVAYVLAALLAVLGNTAAGLGQMDKGRQPGAAACEFAVGCYYIGSTLAFLYGHFVGGTATTTRAGALAALFYHTMCALGTGFTNPFHTPMFAFWLAAYLLAGTYHAITGGKAAP
mmetsp:Transcript_60025/g.120201  ORF Transcript_60025/g.120201 Transcript_60025/m.120201 type:complete len:120 (-) Transcript_60025:66-425(-)